jgi:hypothetical protein
MTELRPYQIEAVADFNREREAGKRRIMLVAPTGSGKTINATTIIKQYVDTWKNALALSHRLEKFRRQAPSCTTKIFRTGSSKPDFHRDRLSACRSHPSRRYTRVRFARIGWTYRLLICCGSTKRIG